MALLIGNASTFEDDIQRLQNVRSSWAYFLAFNLALNNENMREST